MTDEERAARLKACRERFDRLQPFLAEGVTVSHTVCAGILKEHVLVDFEQGSGGWIWLSGYPTGDTMRQLGEHFGLADDISPLSITHVERIPVDALEAIGKRVDEPFQLLLFEEVTGEALQAAIDAIELPKCPSCGVELPLDEVPF